MRYAGIIKNDIAAGKKVNLTFFTQGCPRHCEGCHNPETWDFDSGKEFTAETLQSIISGLVANGIQRNFSVMGGEPLCDENLFLTQLVVSTVREKYPDILIYVWTGYTFEELIGHMTKPHLKQILENIDYLIDGPYIQEERDITLAMRGSRNQKIINIREYFKNEIKKSSERI